MNATRVALFRGVFLSLATAKLAGEPACASPCIVSAFAAAICAPSDLGCQCNVPRNLIANCLLSACDASDLAIAISVGDSVCSSYSISIAAPPTPTIQSSSVQSSAFSSATSAVRTTSSPSGSSSSTTPLRQTSSSSTGTQTSPSHSSSTTTSTSSTSSTSSISSLKPALPTPPAENKGVLSTGAKAGIGVGATLGVLLFAGFGAFAFWYGRKYASRMKQHDPPVTTDKAELGPGIPRPNEPRPNELWDTSKPLDAEEKAELERRKRAAELQGTPIKPIDVPTERAELEALREMGNAPVELH